ncbi:UNVERIFIED_CONTAM: hypothetical protein Sindi_2279300 [Sesamum indicum]
MVVLIHVDPRYTVQSPLTMCISFKYIFLTFVILGPSNPKRVIDVDLELLIEELLQLWHVGVRTYDNATNNAFIVPAALMWTVNDLPTYRMASGWSTACVIGCLVSMDDTRAFYLQHDRKACCFDCYRQFLIEHHPYQRSKKAFKKNHIEYKVARLRLRGDQILEHKKRICEWIHGLKFPYGYESNLACCADMTELRMHDMKSHNCHVFMQKLVSTGFREMLP